MCSSCQRAPWNNNTIRYFSWLTCRWGVSGNSLGRGKWCFLQFCSSGLMLRRRRDSLGQSRLSEEPARCRSLPCHHLELGENVTILSAESWTQCSHACWRSEWCGLQLLLCCQRREIWPSSNVHGKERKRERERDERRKKRDRGCKGGRMKMRRGKREQNSKMNGLWESMETYFITDNRSKFISKRHETVSKHTLCLSVVVLAG